MLYAVDATTGTEQWRFETTADSTSPPAVVADTVNAVDKTDTVYALEMSTGEERWRAMHEANLWRSAPVVVADTIYLGSWREEVLALSTDDGSVIWRQQPDSSAFRISTPVVVANGTVFAAGRDGMIVALNPTNGRRKWHVSTELSELGAPTVPDGVVYVGAAS